MFYYIHFKGSWLNHIRVTYGWQTSTYEWHTGDIRVHTSDVRMTCEWHTDDIWVHTSDIRITYEYIRVTYEWHDIRMTFEWHTDDMRFERKMKLTFWKLFDNSLLKYLICKKVPCIQLTGMNFWCTFSTWFFHTKAPYLILYQLTKFQRHIFFTGYQTKCVIKFLFRQLMTS